MYCWLSLLSSIVSVPSGLLEGERIRSDPVGGLVLLFRDNQSAKERQFLLIEAVTFISGPEIRTGVFSALGGGCNQSVR